MLQKFRGMSAGRKAVSLLLLPIVLFALAAIYDTAKVRAFIAGCGKCKEARNTIFGGAVIYALIVQRVATSAPPDPEAATEKAAPAKASRCPFSGSAGDATSCPGAKAMTQ